MARPLSFGIEPEFELDVKLEIGRIIEESAGRLGYQVYEWGVLLKGANSRIAVKIDRAEGISHADCERFSKEFSASLDAEKILPNYFLEVSSPGLNRRLRSAEEYMRFIGAPIKLVFEEEGERTVVKGTITAADNRAVTVRSDRSERVISYEWVVNAHLDY